MLIANSIFVFYQSAVCHLCFSKKLALILKRTNERKHSATMFKRSTKIRTQNFALLILQKNSLFLTGLVNDANVTGGVTAAPTSWRLFSCRSQRSDRDVPWRCRREDWNKINGNRATAKKGSRTFQSSARALKVTIGPNSAACVCKREREILFASAWTRACLFLSVLANRPHTDVVVTVVSFRFK